MDETLSESLNKEIPCTFDLTPHPLLLLSPLQPSTIDFPINKSLPCYTHYLEVSNDFLYLIYCMLSRFLSLSLYLKHKLIAPGFPVLSLSLSLSNFATSEVQ